MAKNLAKTYDPKEFEDRIYSAWEGKGAFAGKIDPERKSYTIVMPPPNITGQLHMGHALDQTLQDVLTRWRRLQGYGTLWLPGTDHASIATEVKVAQRLREEEGLEKDDLGRDAFLERVWDWKEEFGGKITEQCRRLGDSCDWERERFTMDEGCSKAVREFFVQLYKKDLIYKGNRLINWCPDCMTSLSDAEVEHEDQNGHYWYFKYPAADGGEGIIVATSRPETMFGDVAVAVHPDDERYKDMVGKTVVLPLVGRELPVVADPYPDPEKGTGAVKITPAHDFNDFEVGERHGLEPISCINEDATMNAEAGKYEGMDRYECRKAWVADLKEAGYLVKEEDMVIPVGTCYRCHNVVEPMMSDQWFVAMKDLAEPAIKAVKDGSVNYVPERFTKTHLHWLEDIKDWCISRQLWWGHRIPAWYCDDCGEITVASEDPTCCEHCGSKNIHQDEDVLDTWFSSALWPFSTLGWPDENAEDLKYFFPTDVLVTGYDIIFFWVVRMVFSTYETMGEAPFKYVYVHGLVRDSQGRKMSKSLGNGIDPLDVIDEYGADALRFMLTNGITPGNDIRFSTEKVEAARNFANKLWNASRFVIMNLQDEAGNFVESTNPAEAGDALKAEDIWMLATIKESAGYITDNMGKFELALASQKIYDLIWNEYCDWYIEMVKGRLYGDDEADKKVARGVLLSALKDLLRMLHPFMPFITEEIWGVLPHDEAVKAAVKKAGNSEFFLCNDTWPLADPASHVTAEGKAKAEEALKACALTEEEKAEIRKIETAKNVVKAVRNIRAEVDAQPSKKLPLIIVAATAEEADIKETETLIKELANITSIEYRADASGISQDAASNVISGAEVYIPLEELVDVAAEQERLTKEKERLEGEVARCEKMLANPGFTGKAPAEKVQAERDKLEDYKEQLTKVEERLAALAK